MEKINALFSLVEASGLSAPLFRGYVEKPIAGFCFSIIDCLTRGECLEEAASLPEMLRVADKLSREQERRIEKRSAGGSKLSEAEKDLILMDNLLSLGTGYSQGDKRNERKSGLEKNVKANKKC